MQKLKDNRGSVLVGVVAFTAILVIVVLSTIGLVRNMQNNEDAAFNEAKLSGAVESGLILGAALVNKQNSYATANNDLFASAPVSVNGITVTVRSTPSGTDAVLITATATKVGGAYSKRITMVLVKGAGNGLLTSLSGIGTLSGGAITMSGSAGANMVATDGTFGKIHTWTTAKLAWSSFITGGGLEAVNSIKMANSSSGIDTITKVDSIPFPTFPTVNVNAYVQTAINNSMVFSSVAAAMAVLPVDGGSGVQIPGGVLYITSAINSNNFSWNKKVLKGMVIADGNITIANDKNIIGTSTSSYCAISKNGNVTFSGSTLTATGSIYAPNGFVRIRNSRAIDGNILAKNNITFSENTAAVNGLLFSNSGSVTIANSCSVTGQVVSKTGFSMSGNARLQYKYPSGGYILDNTTGTIGSGSPTIVANSWDEKNK